MKGLSSWMWKTLNFFSEVWKAKKFCFQRHEKHRNFFFRGVKSIEFFFHKFEKQRNFFFKFFTMWKIWKVIDSTGQVWPEKRCSDGNNWTCPNNSPSERVLVQDGGGPQERWQPPQDGRPAACESVFPTDSSESQNLRFLSHHIGAKLRDLMSWKGGKLKI